MPEIGATRRNAWTFEDGVVDLTRHRATLDPRPIDFPTHSQVVRLDLARTACIVVDMQNDFCTPGGWLENLGVDVTTQNNVVGPLEELLPTLRDNDVPIIWLNWGNRPDRANLPPNVIHVFDPDGETIGIGKELPNTHSRVLEKSSWSAAIIEGLTVDERDIHVDKYRMSGFIDTQLQSVLANLDVTTLLFAGVNLDQCVYSTLTEAAGIGYDCILLEDCCATSSPAACVEATYYNVGVCYGFVATSKSIVQAIGEVSVSATALEPLSVTGVSAIEPHFISAGDTVRLALLRAPDALLDSSVFFEVWDVGGAQPDNTHKHSVETFFFLKGEGTAYCDGEIRPVRAGDYLTLAPGTVHRIQNTGESQLYAITTMIPDNGFADMVTSGPLASFSDEDRQMFEQFSTSTLSAQ